MDIAIKYAPNAKQTEFHMSTATETLYGGA